jgi:hypothetical protein
MIPLRRGRARGGHPVIAPAGLGLIAALLAIPSARADEAVTISEAKTDGAGFLVHDVRSPFQAKVTQIRVLRPTRRRRSGRNTQWSTSCRSRPGPRAGTGTG